MTEEPWVPSESLLEELALLLEADMMDFTHWLDVGQSEILLFEFDPYDVDPDEIEDPDEAEQVRTMQATPDRFHQITDYAMHSVDLGSFVRSIRDPRLRQALYSAMDGGRGAFQRVRAELRRRGKEQLFEDYRTAAQLRMAREWLAERGLIPDPYDSDDEYDEDDEE